VTKSSDRYARGLSRAAGGAIIFALPLFMTMEMWWLGSSIDDARLLLLIVVLLPTLVGLSYHAGFEPTFVWREDVADALAAFAVGFCTSLVMLALLGVLTLDTSVSTAIGRVAVQTVPASIGAMLARTQLGGEHADEDGRPRETYGGEIFVMGAGALFLAFSVAPTEEVLILGYRLSPTGGIVLALASMLIMHAFVYAVEFHGQASRPEHTTAAAEFLRLTAVGYALSLCISAYVLWTYGRTDDLALLEIVRSTIVLALPASIGAAAARLIL
jgi:putative integral membrane protein (TIGR02587 family)